MDFTFIIIISYVVGALPTSIIIAKSVAGIDIRQHGSGNAGMTNIVRVVGWKPGLIVGAVDIFKGWVATAWFPHFLLINSTKMDISIVQIAAGAAAVLGHTFTIFAGFRGGKGIATLAGMMIALYPVAVAVCIFTFGVTFITWGYVSVSSMTASVTLPLVVIMLPLIGFSPPPQPLMIFSIMVPIFVFLTHRDNINRLRQGNEKRFEKAVLSSRKNQSKP